MERDACNYSFLNMSSQTQHKANFRGNTRQTSWMEGEGDSTWWWWRWWGQAASSWSPKEGQMHTPDSLPGQQLPCPENGELCNNSKRKKLMICDRFMIGENKIQ